MTKKSNKIAALDTEYAKKKYVEFQQQQRQLIFRRRRLAAIFLGALVIFAVIGFQIFHDMQKMNTLNELKVEADTELRQLNEDVNRLNEDVTLLKDEDYVAKLARSKFFYSKDGEQVYPVPDSTTSNPTEGNDKTTSSTTAP